MAIARVFSVVLKVAAFGCLVLMERIAARVGEWDV